MAEGSPLSVETREEQRARIEGLVQEHGIDTVKLGAIDIDGLWRGKRVPVEYFLGSVWRDGSHICNIMFGWDIQDALIPELRYTGWHTGYPDFFLVPDLSTFAVVPWEDHTASVICDFVEEDGSALALSPRQVLRTVVQRAEERGYVPRIGYELEFYLFRESMESVRDKRYFDLRPLTPGISTYSLYRGTLDEFVVGDIRRQMGRYGISLEASNTEYGPGQFEINLHYADALKAADQAAMYKTGVKEIAGSHGLMASFMAKYDAEWAGCSGHIHQSLADADGTDLFYDPDAPRHISEVARWYAAGLLATMPEFTAFFCPTVNSYKRKVEGSWAATTATWAVENRTTGLRVIKSSPSAARVEHRLPGADANPYVAVAACVAAGLHGVENKLDPPELSQGNVYELRSDQVAMLPWTLEEAVAELERSELARELLGEEFVEHFLATRRWELECARGVVTDWERARYFEMV